MINAGIYSADGIILDLEDSVSPEKKDEARILVRNALRQLYFNSSERMVRINQGDMGILDLEVIIPQNVNMVLLPKSEDPGYIRDIDKRITEIKNRSDIFNPVYLMPIIETALGVEMAFEIARASDSVVAVAVGLEDLTADLGVERTPEGKETLYARARVINAARAAGIQPTDSVFPDKDDLEALRKYALISNSLGFEGMGCIHPRQISVVKQVFAPGPEEITRSGRIVLAFDDARSKGLSVVSLGSKMIDPPVVARAMKNIELAVKMNLLPADWKNQHLIE
jgi:citrate lyase subunit beta/citryl-CoA lyase